MPPRLQPFRPLFQSLVLICLLLAGCGSRDAGGPAAASGPDAGAGENAGSGWSEALWGDGSARQDGLITEANELGSIGFYFDAAEGKAGSLYVGQFMATLPAAEAAA